MTTTTTTTRPCDPSTLIGMCTGDCGRQLHRHRATDPYGACADEHPLAETGIKEQRPLCSGCRRRARTDGTPPTDPATPRGVGGWWEQAACRDQDPELFFPVAATGTAYHRQVAAAKTVCGRCPVQLDCLGEALERIPYGIAGGLTAQERAQLRACHR